MKVVALLLFSALALAIGPSPSPTGPPPPSPQPVPSAIASPVPIPSFTPGSGAMSTPQAFAEYAFQPDNIGQVMNVAAELSCRQDMVFPSSVTGVILTDRSTGTQYRLYVSGGVLSIEQAP